jgi:DNA polymerase/3'-5' exonuclease PolX
MSSKQRIPLARARIIAGEIVDLLTPVCERIEVAGSVRREKATVGDNIEIVCVPHVRCKM